MSDDNEYVGEDIIVDGVTYRVATKRKPDGFIVYWSCRTCQQGHTWKSTSADQSEAIQIAWNKLHSHHASGHR